MIIVISGPTAVGKTKMSVELAKIFNGEIINADSMQVYKNLDIGTAKVTEEEKDGIPHHLFDIKEVWEDFNIYDYQKLGREVIDNLLKKGKTPIIVGGSALYIKALLYDFKFKKEEKKDYSLLNDEEIIKKINDYGVTEIKDKRNRRRIERLLEKLENNTYRDNVDDKLIYDDVIFIGLTTDRNILYDKINSRVDKMMEDGLISEVERVYQYKDAKSLQTGIGYKEVIKYLDKEITLEECVELIKKNSRHYAKRQYTFLRHQLVIWFNVNYDDFNDTILQVKNYILSFCKK